MPNDRESDFVRPSVKQREHAAVDAAACGCTIDRTRRELGRPRMRRMSLAHHSAPRRECRRCVAARNGERERKIARAENTDGPEWHEHATEVRLRERRTGRVTAVDARVHP